MQLDSTSNNLVETPYMPRRSTRATVQQTMDKIRNSAAWIDVDGQDLNYFDEIHENLSKNGFSRVELELTEKDTEWWWKYKGKLKNGDPCHGGRSAFDLKLSEIPKSFMNKIFKVIKPSICAYYGEDQRTDKVRLRNVENIQVYSNAPDQPLHRDHSLGPHIVLTLAISMNPSRPLQTRFVPGSHKSNQLDGIPVKPSIQSVIFDCATLHGGSSTLEDDEDRLFFVLEHPAYENSTRMQMIDGNKALENQPTLLI